MTPPTQQQIAELLRDVNDWDGCYPGNVNVANLVIRMHDALESLAKERDETVTPRHIDEWHEDDGPVLWWTNPISEPPYSGSPLDDDWPEYHEWWTPLSFANDINKRLVAASPFSPKENKGE